ncbi:MAG: OsmC family protein [Chloroflexota bacterium]
MEKARVVTEAGYVTSATNDRHTWHADVGEAAGGEDTAPNPEELLLGALGSCTVQTMHMYANRKGWDLQRVEVDLELDKVNAAEVPDYDGAAKFINMINKHIRLHGDLTDEQRERIMTIGTKCPVHRIISSPTTRIQQTLLKTEGA